MLSVNFEIIKKRFQKGYESLKRFLLKDKEKIYNLFFSEDSPYQNLMKGEFSIENLQSFKDAIEIVISNGTISKKLRMDLEKIFYDPARIILLSHQVEFLESKISDINFENNHAKKVLECSHKVYENYQGSGSFSGMLYGIRSALFPPPTAEYFKCLHDAYAELKGIAGSSNDSDAV